MRRLARYFRLLALPAIALTLTACGNGPGIPPAAEQPPAQALTNLVGTLVRVGGGLRVAAAVTNLFDVTLADPGGAEHAVDRIAQPGRGFWIQLEYTFR